MNTFKAKWANKETNFLFLFYIAYGLFILVLGLGRINLKPYHIPLSLGGNLGKLALYPFLIGTLHEIFYPSQWIKRNYSALGLILLILTLSCLSVFFNDISPEVREYQSFILGILTFLMTLKIAEVKKMRNFFIYFLLIAGNITILTGWLNFILGDHTFLLGDGTSIRLNTPIGHPNFLGGFLVLLLPLSLSIQGNELWKETLKFISFSNLLLGLIMSFSRSAWLGTFFALLYYSRPFITKRTFLYGFISMFFLLIPLSIPSIHNPVLNRVSSLKSLKNDSNIIERVYAFKNSTNLIVKSPIIGIGPGKKSYLNHTDQCRLPQSRLRLPHSHNLLLQWGVSYGLPATILFFLLISLVLFHLNKAKQNPEEVFLARPLITSILGFFIYSLMDFGLYSPHVSAIFWLILALSFSIKNKAQG